VKPLSSTSPHPLPHLKITHTRESLPVVPVTRSDTGPPPIISTSALTAKSDIWAITAPNAAEPPFMQSLDLMPPQAHGMNYWKWMMVPSQISQESQLDPLQPGSKLHKQNPLFNHKTISSDPLHYVYLNPTFYTTCWSNCHRTLRRDHPDCWGLHYLHPDQ